MTNIENLDFQNLNEDIHNDISDIYQKSLSENKQGFIQSTSFHGSIIDQVLDIEKDGGHFIAMSLNDKTIGFGALKSHKNDAQIFELCKLHLLSKYQGKGLGKYLTKELVKLAKSNHAKKIDLHVTITQTHALNLYKNLGFKQTGRQVFEVEVDNKTQSFDTVLMELKL
ncbi:MAG: GNAT family N-acetyltransferase [Gammaproteobacteria bacterium]|nr:GNAT family N-acetyltransferase [Gammaproteobacteria bacterium]